MSPGKKPLASLPREKQLLKPATIKRLLKYYDFVREIYSLSRVRHVSSADLAMYASCEGSLVRRDLASVGVNGQARVGFKISDILTVLKPIIHNKKDIRAVLFGVGRLGRLLLHHDWNHQTEVRICAAFDSTPKKQGTVVSGITVESFRNAKTIIEEQEATIAILSVPSSAAQICTDLAVSSGVTAIWNFAPCLVTVPETVIVRNENFASSLQELCCLMPS